MGMMEERGALEAVSGLVIGGEWVENCFDFFEHNCCYGDLELNYLRI